MRKKEQTEGSRAPGWLLEDSRRQLLCSLADFPANHRCRLCALVCVRACVLCVPVCSVYMYLSIGGVCVSCVSVGGMCVCVLMGMSMSICVRLYTNGSVFSVCGCVCVWMCERILRVVHVCVIVYVSEDVFV